MPSKRSVKHSRHSETTAVDSRQPLAKSAARKGEGVTPIREPAAKDAGQQKIEELTELLQRVQAESENYRKRVEREFETRRQYCNGELLQRLLPVIDSFEEALKQSGNKEEFVRGVKLIYGQLNAILKAEGLSKIECLNKPFDPYLHEVMMHVRSDKEGIVIGELQKGYMLKDRVLRHAKVKVGKQLPDEDKKEHKKGNCTGDGQGL